MHLTKQNTMNNNTAIINRRGAIIRPAGKRFGNFYDQSFHCYLRSIFHVNPGQTGIRLPGRRDWKLFFAGHYCRLSGFSRGIENILEKNRGICFRLSGKKQKKELITRSFIESVPAPSGISSKPVYIVLLECILSKTADRVF